MKVELDSIILFLFPPVGQQDKLAVRQDIQRKEWWSKYVWLTNMGSDLGRWVGRHNSKLW